VKERSGSGLCDGPGVHIGELSRQFYFRHLVLKVAADCFGLQGEF
jgi:hypothetical protein